MLETLFPNVTLACAANALALTHLAVSLDVGVEKVAGEGGVSTCWPLISICLRSRMCFSSNAYRSC